VRSFGVTVVTVSCLGGDGAGGEGKGNNGDAENFHRMTPVERGFSGTARVRLLRPHGRRPEVGKGYGSPSGRR